MKKQCSAIAVGIARIVAVLSRRLRNFETSPTCAATAQDAKESEPPFEPAQLTTVLGPSEDDVEADEDEDVDDVGNADADIDALTAQVQGATLDHDLL